MFNRLSCICVRDSLSRKNLLEYGIEAARIRETADAAFLWRGLAPELFRLREGRDRTISLCFRGWPPGDRASVDRNLGKALCLCFHLLQGSDRELLFLSTCQGIPGYVDDSELALKIVASLPRSLQERCRVDRVRYSSRNLVRALGATDAFIGMRLHGAILAMLGGTPAMAIGYEPKTEEVFRQAGLDRYQIHFEEDDDAWIECAERFLADTPTIRQKLPDVLDRLCDRAEENLEAVLAWLPR